MNHKEGSVPGFTKRYGVDRLVYFEMHPTMQQQSCERNRSRTRYCAWKIALIERLSVPHPSKEVLDGVGIEQPP